MKKRLAVLLLLCLLALTMSSCKRAKEGASSGQSGTSSAGASASTESGDPQQSSVSQAQQSNGHGSGQSNEHNSGQSSAVSGTAQSRLPSPDLGSPAQQTPSDEIPLQLGVLRDKTWENAFLALGCRLPAAGNWTLSSSESLRQKNRAPQGLSDTEYLEYLKETSRFYDLSACCEDTGTLLTITLEKAENVTQEAFLAKSIAALSLSYAEAEDTEYKCRAATFQLAGKQWRGIRVSGNIGGIDFYESYVFLRQGDYIASISIISYSTDDTNDLLSCFYAL